MSASRRGCCRDRQRPTATRRDEGCTTPVYIRRRRRTSNDARLLRATSDMTNERRRDVHAHATCACACACDMLHVLGHCACARAQRHGVSHIYTLKLVDDRRVTTLPHVRSLVHIVFEVCRSRGRPLILDLLLLLSPASVPPPQPVFLLLVLFLLSCSCGCSDSCLVPLAVKRARSAQCTHGHAVHGQDRKSVV